MNGINYPNYQSSYQPVQTHPDYPVRNSPYGISFENEKMMKEREIKKYREDLDYLIKLRRTLGEEEFNERYGGDYLREFEKRILAMEDKYQFNQYENRNFKKNIMKTYEDDMLTHKDRERLQRKNDLDFEKKRLESLDYQTKLDKQRKVDQRLKMKNDQFIDLDQFYQKKHAEEQMKYEDRLSNIKLMEEQVKMQNDRDNQYRSRLNNMNENIYNNALNFSGYLQSENQPQSKEPFYVKNDSEFNRKVAEMNQLEKESQRKDTLVNERMKEIERMREYQNKMKMDKMENQKLYKDYLDYQSFAKEKTSGNNVSDDCQLIMPAYHYPNKPLPNARKANDAINWVKKNHLETLSNGSKAVYLGDTNLKHNPIILPLNDMDYNRYLNKQRQILSNGNLSKSANFERATLAKVGNSIVS